MAGPRSRSGPATGLVVVAIAIVAVAIGVIFVVRGSRDLASATPTRSEASSVRSGCRR